MRLQLPTPTTATGGSGWESTLGPIRLQLLAGAMQNGGGTGDIVAMLATPASPLIAKFRRKGILPPADGDQSAELIIAEIQAHLSRR